MIRLGPLKTSKRKLRQLKQKQKSWVLDCINQDKSKLKPYSAIKDKFLKYFVVRVPKKKKFNCNFVNQNQNQCVSSSQFKNFLLCKKRKILENQSEYQKDQQNIQKGCQKYWSIQEKFILKENKNLQNDKQIKQVKNKIPDQNKIQQKYSQKIVILVQETPRSPKQELHKTTSINTTNREQKNQSKTPKNQQKAKQNSIQASSRSQRQELSKKQNNKQYHKEDEQIKKEKQQVQQFEQQEQQQEQEQEQNQIEDQLIQQN